MFGMWRGLAGLSTCWFLLMLLHFSSRAGMKCDFLPCVVLTTQRDALKVDDVGLGFY